jgi:hypothetical protein
MPAEGESPRAGTQGTEFSGSTTRPWVPDISLARNSGMTVSELGWSLRLARSANPRGPGVGYH